MPYIVLGLFGLYTLEFGVVGVLPIITERFDVSVPRAGLLMALFALVVAVTGPFSVLLSSRLDRRLVLVGAQLVFALCSALSAFAPNFDVLMALRVVPALLHPVFFAAAFTAAVSLYPKDRQAHATSMAIIGTTLGLVVGVPATAWFGAQFSYEASFLFCAAVTLAAGVGLLIKLPRTTRATPLSFGHQVSILRKAAVWLNILATILTLAAMFAVYSYAAEYLKSETGLDGRTVSLMLLIFGMGGLLGNLIVGRLLVRRLVVTVLVYPCVLALSYVVLKVLGTDSVPAMIPIALFWGAAHTSGLVVTQVWLTTAAPEAHSFATSLFVSSANAGVVFGAAVGGLFIDEFGLGAVITCGLAASGLAFLVILLKVAVYGAGSTRRSFMTTEAKEALST